MQLSYQALVLATVSLQCALAQPAHRHQHQHKRDSADVVEKRVDFGDPSLYKDVDWSSVFGGPAASTPAPSPSTAPSTAPSTGGSSVDAKENVVVPAQASSASPAPASSTPATHSSAPSSNSGSCSDLSSVWTTGDSSGVGGSTSVGSKFTSFGAQTASKGADPASPWLYQGNVGSPYGHNIMPLPDCQVGNNQYSLSFTNSGDKEIKIALWNKPGDDGKPNSGQSRNAFYTFPLEPKQNAMFAIQPNTQLAWSQACARNTEKDHEENPKITAGVFGCVWGEADFGNEGNHGASGYDRSTIESPSGDVGVLSISAPGFATSEQGKCLFTSDQQPNTGCATDVPAGQPMHLQVTMA